MGDRFTSIFGEHRGPGRSYHWPPEDGERLFAVLDDDPTKKQWRLVETKSGELHMVGKLWCETESLEGWVDFVVQVYPGPGSKSLYELIDAVTGKAAVWMVSWPLKSGTQEKVQSLAALMDRQPLLVDVGVGEDGRVSVAHWLGPCAPVSTSL